MTTSTEYKDPGVIPPIVADRLAEAAETLVRTNRRAALVAEVEAAHAEALMLCRECGARGHTHDDLLAALARSLS